MILNSFNSIARTARSWRFRTSLMAVISGAFAASAAAADITTDSPLSVAGASFGGSVTRLAIRTIEFNALLNCDRATVSGFALDATQFVNLDLRRVEVFAPDAVIVAVGPNGETALPRPTGVILAGSIVGRSDSRVTIGLTDSMVNGIVEADGFTWILSNAAGSTEPVIYRADAVPADALQLADVRCATDEIAQPRQPIVTAGSPGGAAGPRGAPPCRSARIAIETDFELLNDRFGGNTNSCNAYIALLVAATSGIYERDVNTSLSISFVRLWTTAADPWTQSGATDQLFQFRDYWNLNMTAVQREAAHFLSSRGLGGGVAYVNALCEAGFDYGLDGNLNGSFPYPVQHNSSSNWDLMVFAHELGHNFGAPHTHSMSPPVDNCASGDCSVTPNGTIMSYCHLCSGGLANVRMEMHPRTINEEILPYLDSAPCDLVVAGPTIDSITPSGAVCFGSNFTLQVTASGGGTIAYQWRKNGTDIAGATAATYAITPFGPTSPGTYSVVVSNSCGSVPSENVILTGCTNNFDVNGDCTTDLTDLSILLAHFGSPGTHADGDLSGNGFVDLTDLSLLLSRFGASGC